jgi:hypothetical protein
LIEVNEPRRSSREVALIFISRSARSAQEQLCVEFREIQSYRTLCKEELYKVCIEQEER